MVVWDGVPTKFETPENHKNKKGCFTTKHHGTSFNRLEGVDLEGRPVFLICLAASTSPRATDEAMCYFLLELEENAGLDGGLKAMLVGAPGYCMVHYFDNGFRYTIIYFFNVILIILNSG